MKFFNFYINSSTHVAFAVVAFYQVSCFELGIAFSWHLFFFLFFATITGYNFVKYAGIAKLHHISLTNNLRLIQLFSLGVFFIMLYFAFKLSFFSWVVLTSAVALNILYALPVFSNKRNLRSIPLLKVFIIALVWTIATVIMPLTESVQSVRIDYALIYYGVQRFLIVFCLMIPFEVRDVNYDLKSITTIPQILSINNTKLLGLLVLLTCCIINLNIIAICHFIVFSVIALLLGMFILFSKTHQSIYFASFWVESVPIIYFLALYLICY